MFFYDEDMEKIYLCIDLKSFYASVECVERGLDPFKINLVVADPERGNGAITLAATPAIKSLGVKSRGRIFEIPKNIEYIIAPPRMHLYMEYAARIYKIFLKYIAAEDIHVYSIDESFLDITPYLHLYRLSAKQLAQEILNDIFKNTGITATVGIGTNLFLAKVALDILAKHEKDNMGYLDEDVFRQLIWHHQPLTDIWMIGPGSVKRLKTLGINDLYGVAHCPPKALYKLFGINAEILIDHAWGKEPVEIKDIKAYKPQNNGLFNSQILFEDYDAQKAEIVLKEMVDANVLTLNARHLVCRNISLSIHYSKDIRPVSRALRNIESPSNSYAVLSKAFLNLFKEIVDPDYPIRQIGIAFGKLQDEDMADYDLFTDFKLMDKERSLARAVNAIRQKYGKNACLKGTNYLDGATGRYRNQTIGGHKA